MTTTRRPSRLLAAATALLALASAALAQDAPQKFLVIVVDGLRPDYITPEVMPNLHSLGETGVFFERHHAAIPTLTRVNAASFSTGAYPETHGLLGNVVYFPQVSPDRALNTGDYENLAKIAAAEGGRLVTATTLGEVLVAAGKKFIAVSSGSTGSAFLLNSTVSGGGVVHPELVLPASQRDHVLEVVGAPPAEAVPATAFMAWAVDAYLKIARAELDADVAFLWFTDPDHTAHSQGIGTPLTIEALRSVDSQIGRVLEAHAQRGLASTINVLVTSDHGFTAWIGGFDVESLLARSNLSAGVHQTDLALYVDNHDRTAIRRIVELLQREPTVGPIFTAAATSDSDQGSVPGTLSFGTLRWQHARSGDILAFPSWDDGPAAPGVAGRTMSGTVNGNRLAAGHGSTSPFDVHNTLIASGPAFKTRLRSRVPSANPDLAPTILNLLGLPAPPTMTGRVLREALANGPDPASVDVTPLRHSAEVTLPRADGKRTTYRSTVEGAVVDGRVYIDQARGTRDTSP